MHWGLLLLATEVRDVVAGKPNCCRFDGVLHLRQTLKGVRSCNSEWEKVGEIAYGGRLQVIRRRAFASHG